MLIYLNIFLNIAAVICILYMSKSFDKHIKNIEVHVAGLEEALDRSRSLLKTYQEENYRVFKQYHNLKRDHEILKIKIPQ